MAAIFDDILGYGFGALILFSFAYGLFVVVSYHFKPYHKANRVLSRRKAKAIKNNNYKTTQQVALEELWLQMIRNKYDYEVNSELQSYFKRKNELDIETYNRLAKGVKNEDLIMPNENNIISFKYRIDFFDIVLEKAEQARAQSPFKETYYFPESILQYPLDYLRFALSKIRNNYFEAKEKDDDKFHKFIKGEFNNIKYFYHMLFNRVIDIDASLLSADPVKNKSIGDIIKGNNKVNMI